MRELLFLLLLTGLFACSHNTKDYNALKNKIDSLENKLAETYKPGFGELMSAVQVHHEKLWFAGINDNWKLADFEIHEINESLEDIKKFQSDRPESKDLDMINSGLDLIKTSIKEQNTLMFKNAYSILTNTCNECHKVTDFEFNIVKIPEAQSFSNQEFRIKPLN
jgi:predicted MPP superfamily phosphohydrolase